MTVSARLKDGEMRIAGSFNERLPAIQSGLIAYYPFDGTLNPVSGTFAGTNTNTTLTYSGIAVEEATTNLFPCSSNASTGWNLKSGDLLKVISFSTNKVIYRYDANANLWNYNGVSVISLTGGQAYTASVEMFVSSDWNGNYTPYCACEQSGGVFSNYNMAEKGTWQKFSLTWTPATTINTNMLLYPCANNSTATKGYVLFRNPQLEAKRFKTSFVNGSRSAGTLIIPVSLTNLDFTIFGYISHATPIDNSILSNSTDIWLNGSNGCGLRYYNPGVVNPWIDADSWAQPHNHANAGVFFPANVFLPFYIRRMGTELSWNYYNNGIWYKWTVAPTSAQTFDSITFNNGGGNSNYKNISIYNRALSVSEIDKLHNNKINLKSTGDLSSVIIYENPIIPSNVFNFPFDFSAKDTCGSVSPVLESNTIYTRDGVWVGTAATNIIKNPKGRLGASAEGYNPGWDASLHPKAITVTDWSSGYNSGVPSPTIGYHAQFVNEGIEGTEPCIKMIDRNDIYSLGHRWLGIAQTLGSPLSLGWSAGTAITLSLKQKADVFGKGIYWGIYHKRLDNATYDFESCINYTSPQAKLINSWYESSYTYTITSNWDLTASASIYIYGSDGAYGTLWADNIQIITSPFNYPFINGTCGAGALNYNFNSSIGLDWNGDWTICYWKQPIGTHANSMTGYNIESLGCNGNTVGGGYTWFGKTNGSNTLGGGFPAYSFTKYFTKWHMISITKSGTNIIYKAWGIDGTIQTNTVAVGTIASNYYVTQYGYDFKLGGWDNSNPCNSYYKDLIVAKRALTNTELQTIYNTQMRMYNNALLVRNGISEGYQLV